LTWLKKTSVGEAGFKEIRCRKIAADFFYDSGKAPAGCTERQAVSGDLPAKRFSEKRKKHLQYRTFVLK